jgi:two-component system sensor histidine kinase PhoQ
VTIKTLIKTGRQRSGLIIEIGDDGPGIAEQKRENLLQRGVRGDEKVTGHGIGLSIVTDIVDSYQGELTIDRDPELMGAHFKIVLPP